MKPTDFCSNTNKQCRGVYSYTKAYSLDCVQLGCQKDSYHPYDCKDFCAKSKKMCHRLLKIVNLVQQYLNRPEYSNELKKYNSFVNSFQMCPQIKHELQSAEVCLNTKSCLYMETKLTDELTGRKHLACPCFGKLNYHCGHHHCASHNRACDAFKANSSSKVTKSVKKCNSFNLFAQRKLVLV